MEADTDKDPMATPRVDAVDKDALIARSGSRYGTLLRLAKTMERELNARPAAQSTGDDKIVTCVYCGREYPPGTPASQHELLTAHIRVCEKHPMREKEELIASALKVIRDATDGALDGSNLLAACHIIVSQRDNARVCEDTWHERYLELQRVKEWRLIRVDYGEDVGLVELHRGLLVAITWDTSRVSMMSDLPKVVVENLDMMELFGDEHSWNDVIPMLQQHYHWNHKTLPDMDELRKHYPPTEPE